MRHFTTIIAIIVILVFVFVPSNVEGKQETQIKISPPETIGGNKFCTRVLIRGATDIYGISAILQYDPEELIVDEINPGGFLCDGFEKVSVDNNQGKALYIGTKTGDVKGVDGDGELFCVTYESDGNGHLTYDSFDINLSDSNIEQIYINEIENPIIKINPLPEYTNEKNIVISGDYSGEIKGIYINDISAEIDIDEKLFYCPVILEEGENAIKVICEDIFGEVFEFNKFSVLDTIPPKIYVDKPKDGMKTYSREIQVIGNVEDEIGIREFFINDVPIELNNGKFDIGITLETYGVNTICFEAIDKADNSTYDEINIDFRKRASGGTKEKDKTSNEEDGGQKGKYEVQDIEKVCDEYVFKVTKGHWAESHFKELLEEGLNFINVEKEFSPDGYMTSTEFVHLLKSAFELFDVDIGGIEEIIGNMGIELGEDFLKRYDVALILSNLLELKSPESLTISYKDLEDIYDEYLEYVEDVSRFGLMLGFADGYFRGEQNITKAESATVILRVIRYFERLEISQNKTENQAIIQSRNTIANNEFPDYPFYIENPKKYITYINEDTIILKGKYIGESDTFRISDKPGNPIIISDNEFEIERRLIEDKWDEIQFYCPSSKKTILRYVLRDIITPEIEADETSIPEDNSYISSWGQDEYPIYVKIIDKAKTGSVSISGIDEEEFRIRLNDKEGKIIGKPSIISGGSNTVIPDVIKSMTKGFKKESLDKLPDGNYKLEISFADKAGNKDKLIRDFTFDRTPPIVEMRFPEEGDAVSGNIMILGKVYDENISEYRLYIKGEDEDGKLLLSEGETNIDGILGEIDTTEFGNGKWILIIEGTDKAENVKAQEITININNSGYNVNGNIELQHIGVKEGVEVYLKSKDIDISTVTDEKGNFDFQVPEGEYTLEVIKKGYLAFEKVFYVDEDFNQNIGAILFPGDLNGDGIIDEEDLKKISEYFSISSGDKGWNPDYDFNDDGIINIFDIVITALNINNPVIF